MQLVSSDWPGVYFNVKVLQANVLFEFQSISDRIRRTGQWKQLQGVLVGIDVTLGMRF